MRPSPTYVIPATIVTLGLYRLWYNQTWYLLERTKLRAERDILHRTEEEVPLKRITSVTAHQRLLPGTSEVVVGTGAGEHTVSFPHLNRADAREFAEQINAAREQPKRGSRGVT